MKVDVVIPSCKPFKKLEKQVYEILDNTDNIGNVHAVSNTVCASLNRNEAHRLAETDIVVMMDDDMTGFFKDWLNILVKPLSEDENIKICSARLMKDPENTNFMMTSKFKLNGRFEEVPRIPTACFAYRKKDVDAIIGFHNDTSKPFDEKFEGAGWEDNAFCHDLKKKFPNMRIVIVNDCKLIHINEAKNNHPYFNKNKEYFFGSGRTER